MDILERSNKKFLKHILGAPNTITNPAVYIITGTIPLTRRSNTFTCPVLFCNFCRLDDTSIQTQLTERHLTVKVVGIAGTLQ